MLRVLFLCSRNRRRSPTAEQLFSGREGLEVLSAGLAPDAEEPVTADHLEWADLILVMEKAHRARLNRRYGALVRHARIGCLDISDSYDFMQKELVDLLIRKVDPLIKVRGRGV